MNLEVNRQTQTAATVSTLRGQSGRRARARLGVKLLLCAATIFALCGARPSSVLAQSCSCQGGKDCEKVKLNFTASVCSAHNYTVTLAGQTATGSGSCTANTWVTTPETEVELTVGRVYKLVAGTSSCSTHIFFNVPKPYRVLVNGVETRTIDAGGTTKGSGDGTWDVVVHQCDACEDNERVESCDSGAGSVNWSVSLGKLSDGRSASTLSIREDLLSAAIYTPAALSYAPPLSSEIDVVRNQDGSLRQIKVPRALGDVVVISAQEYDVRFYDPANVGAKVNGLYTVSGQPFVTWKIKNPDPTSTSRLQISEIQGSTTTTNDYTWDAVTNSWSLSEGNGTRVETKTVTYLTATSRVETTTVKDGAGQLISKLARTFHTYAWGDEVLEVVADPDGAALKTAYSYYENPAEVGRYRKVQSVTLPNGSWEKYDYDANGNQILLMRPWKDQPLASATEANSYTITYTYSNSDGISLSPYPYIVSSITEKIAGTVVSKTSYTRTGTQLNGEPAVIETETVYASATGTLTSSVTKYHATASAYLANKMAVLVRPDGTKDTFSYERGDYTQDADPALSQFTPNPNGTAWRETVVHGTAAAPDGVAFKTTKETTIRNQYGHAVLGETYVYTGTTYVRIAWTAMDYDGRGDLIQTQRSNGELATATWDGNRQTSNIDAFGVETNYTYDALGRVKTETKKGIAATGPYPAQPDVTLTYTYDAEDHVVAKTLAGGGVSLSRSTVFDGAGRVKGETNSEGLTTIYTYANGGRTQTLTYPGGATQITDTYLDGQTKSITGTALVSQQYDYGVNADGTRFTQEFSGSAGLNSPRWLKLTSDWLGRTIKAELPGFTGATLTKTYAYNDKGQLVAQSMIAGTTKLTADVLSEFDELGRQTRGGIDVDGNGSLAPQSTDRIVDTDYFFKQDDADWFDYTVTATYLTDNDATRTELETRRKRLANFPVNGTEKTLTEVRFTNEANQTTTASTVSDRAAKKMTRRVDTPDSNVDSVGTIINGLLQSFNPTTPEAATTYAYDGLGRLVGVTDPRSGTTTSVYHATTGQLLSTSDAVQTTSYEYYPAAHNNAGRLKAVTDGQGKKTYFAYNNRGEKTQTWGDDSYPVEYVYDEYGQQTELHTFRGGQNWSASTWPAAITGAADVTRWIYDEPTGLLTKKRDAAGKEMSYGYDVMGRLLTRTWARLDSFGNPLSATYSYNLVTGDMSGVNYSDATPDVTFAYDRGARATSITDAAGSHTRTFNERGELKTEQISGGILDLVQVSTNYDSFLRRQFTQAARGGSVLASQTYGYDATSRLEMITAGGQNVTYAYYPNTGLLNTTSFTGGTSIGRSYDTLGRLQSITTTPAADAAQSYTYTYNNLHQRTRATREDGSYWAYGYNDRGEVTSGKKFWSDNTPEFGQQTEYAFDNIGNRTTARAGGNPVGNLRQSAYTANSLDQYTQRTVPGAVDVAGTANSAATVSVNNAPSARKGNYFYTEMTVDNSNAPVYAQVNVVGARNNFGAGGEDAVTAQGGRVYVPPAVESYSYDADGNLTSDGRWNYTWDAENRLVTMDAKANVPVEARQRLEFAYDWAGRRIEKKAYGWDVTTGSYQLQSVARFVYDGDNLLAELDGNNTLVRSYVWGQDTSGTTTGAGGVGGLLLINQGGNTYQAGYDGSGNVTTLVNAATGAISASYDYDPFGQTLKAVGDYAAINPFRFSTKYADAETGLVYYGYRYYQPQTGRWLGRDPFGEDGGVNLYGFVSNNPISRIDPNGLYEEDVHYYLTYFLARQSGCFDAEEARLVAEGDQHTDEDEETAPAQGHGIAQAKSLVPDIWPFRCPECEKQRERHRRFHALTDPSEHQANLDALMRDATLPFPCRRDKKKQNDAVRQQKLMAFGRYLHYAQDVFSHRDYPDPWAGHGVEILRDRAHMPDKTHGRGLYPIYDIKNNIIHWDGYDRVERAMEMVRDTWQRLKDWCRSNKCYDRPKQQDANFMNSLPKILRFLNSNGAANDPNANPDDRTINPQELDFKRQLLTDGRGHPIPPRRR